MSESVYIERMNTAEAQVATYRDQVERLKGDSRDLFETLAARKLPDGTIDIDFGKLVQRLSTDHALELRAAIDEHHNISGAPGEKPRIRVRA